MLNDKYSRAYTEVLEIIKYLPEEEYNKIPKEKIEFYKNNMNKDYKFKIDPEIDLADQNVSNEAGAIIVTLFRDYFATEEQKNILEEIIKLNEKKSELQKRKKYNPEDLFKKDYTDEEYNTPIADKDKENFKNTSLVEYKENFFIRFKNFILRLLHLKN